MTTTSHPLESPSGGALPALQLDDRAESSARAIVVVVLVTALALAIRIYQLLRPGFLTGVTEYDDGVDFGSGIRLVYGQLPYRDFVLVHPPGIALLLAPVALVAKSTGTAVGMEIARIVTAVVGAASVCLAGLLVRHRGVLATTVACGILAIYPGSINAAHTVLLEPWLVVFCLLGALVIFDRDNLRRRPARLAWGGVFFGLGAAVKLWAAFPILVVLVLCVRLPSWRPRLAFAGGLSAGFCVPVLPLAALAPHNFYQSVVNAQLTRVDVSRVAESVRLINLTGLGVFPSVTTTAALIFALAVVVVVVGSAVAAGLLTRRWPPELEWFAFGGAVLVLASFMWPSDFYAHYGAFFAPFLALSLALPLSRWVSAVAVRGAGRASQIRRLLAPSLAVVALGAFAYLTVVETNQLSGLKIGAPGPTAARQIPAGACVLTDLPGLTIVSNRFVSASPACSPMVDGIGTDYALASGRNGVTGAGRSASLRAVWLSAFEHAQYVWLQCGPDSRRLCLTNRRIPWTPGLRAYFATHFRRIGHGTIYVRSNALRRERHEGGRDRERPRSGGK